MDYYTTINDNIHFLDGLGFLFVILSIILVAICVFYVIGLWKVFEKAGKPGWACLIPFYGNWVLVEIAELHWLYFIFLIADSIVGILEIDGISTIANIITLYASFSCAYNISKKFNKSVGFSICLFLFGFIFYPILGFSKKEKYNKSIAVYEHAFFGNKNCNNVSDNNFNFSESNSSDEYNYCAYCGTKIIKENKFCPSCGKEV